MHTFLIWTAFVRTNIAATVWLLRKQKEGVNVKGFFCVFILTVPLQQAARRSGRSAGRHPVCIWWLWPGLCWPEPLRCYWGGGKIRREYLIKLEKRNPLGILLTSKWGLLNDKKIRAWQIPKVAPLRNKGHLNVGISHLTKHFLTVLLMKWRREKEQKEFCFAIRPRENIQIQPIVWIQSQQCRTPARR